MAEEQKQQDAKEVDITKDNEEVNADAETSELNENTTEDSTTEDSTEVDVDLLAAKHKQAELIAREKELEEKEKALNLEIENKRKELLQKEQDLKLKLEEQKRAKEEAKFMAEQNETETLEAKLLSRIEALEKEKQKSLETMMEELDRRELNRYKKSKTKGLMFPELVTGKTIDEIDASIKKVKEKEQQLIAKGHDAATTDLKDRYAQLSRVPQARYNEAGRDAEINPVSMKEKIVAFTGKNTDRDAIKSRLEKQKRKAFNKQFRG